MGHAQSVLYLVACHTPGHIPTNQLKYAARVGNGTTFNRPCRAQRGVTPLDKRNLRNAVALIKQSIESHRIKLGSAAIPIGNFVEELGAMNELAVVTRRLNENLPLSQWVVSLLGR